jgi:Uma2 family endonuclease
LPRAIGTKPWTADELHRLPAGWRYEIDEGELVIMAPAGGEHGRTENRVAFVLSRFVYARHLGEILTGETGFRLSRSPETLRGADVAFLSKERWQRVGNPKGFLDVPPDLAVEVHDPSEPDLSRKVQQYLEAGVRAVWVLNPELRSLTRHAPGEAPRTWTDPEAVVEEPVLPGFSCRLGELFGEV